jgi:hypothetical protein
MFGLTWKGLPGLKTGDWPSKLLAIAQIAIGFVAALGLLSMLTRHPLLLLTFATVQGLILLGIVLFVIVAVSAQRAMVLEAYEPGEVIFNEGEEGRYVYVIKSGAVEVLRKRPDGSQEVINRLRPGDHFGEMALLRNAPRNATIRTLTAVQVFKMSPSNFAALYTNLPGLREHFNKVMDARLRELDVRK